MVYPRALTALFPHGHGFATSYSLFHIPPPSPIHLVLICLQPLNNMPDYTYKSSGTNSQGNHYCARDYGSGASNSNSYHYSNQDGSYYYSNPNGSTYYNNGAGSSTYTSPSGNSTSQSQSGGGSKK